MFGKLMDIIMGPLILLVIVLVVLGFLVAISAPWWALTPVVLIGLGLLWIMGGLLYINFLDQNL